MHFGDILENNGFIKYDAEAGHDTFYQKMIGTQEERRYFIEIHEYYFGKFKDYEGPWYRYDVRLSFFQKDGSYLEMRFGIHDFDYRDELVDMIEIKCEKLFTVNEGKHYEDVVSEVVE